MKREIKFFNFTNYLKTFKIEPHFYSTDVVQKEEEFYKKLNCLRRKGLLILKKCTDKKEICWIHKRGKFRRNRISVWKRRKKLYISESGFPHWHLNQKPKNPWISKSWFPDWHLNEWIRKQVAASKSFKFHLNRESVSFPGLRTEVTSFCELEKSWNLNLLFYYFNLSYIVRFCKILESRFPMTKIHDNDIHNYHGIIFFFFVGYFFKVLC